MPSESMWTRLLQLGQLLMDARIVAAGVNAQAQADKEEHPEDYDLTFDIGVLRERVAQLMARVEQP